MAAITTTRRATTFWPDGDVSADVAGVTACGAAPDRWHPTGCTRVAGHDGPHGHPNWSGRITVERGSLGWLDIVTENSHQRAPAHFRSRAEALEFVDFLKRQIDETFPE